MAQTGYTPISLYYSTTASQAPTAGNLANGELAINITDGKLYYKDNTGTVKVIAGSGGTGIVAGSNTQIQFNNNGVFGASANLTWDGSFLTVASIKDSALTSGRVTYAGASGLLTDSANMTFNGTKLTVAGFLDSALTSGRVPYATTSGELTDSANLLYSGTDLTVYGITVGRGAGAVAGNTAVGENALASNATGTDLTAVGKSAYRYGTAVNNTAFGSNAMGSGIVTGTENTALGRASLFVNTSGSNNLAAGTQALFSNTTGGSNTALGTAALLSNTTASNNTAVGYQAGYSNTTGAENTSVGVQALYTNTTGPENSAFGRQALYSNTTGGYNVALGLQALRSNTTASNNTAVGYQAGYSNTTSASNTYIGYQVGLNATGNTNVGVGANVPGFYNASLYSTTGSGNTALGAGAGGGITSGSTNIAIGNTAMAGGAVTGSTNIAIGWGAGIALTSGSSNTFVGSGRAGFQNGAGSAMTTGNANTILGSFSGNQGGLDIRTANNYIVLSDGDGNPRLFIDGSGSVVTNSSGTVYSFSGSSGSLLLNNGSTDTPNLQFLTGNYKNWGIDSWNSSSGNANQYLRITRDLQESTGRVIVQLSEEGTLALGSVSGGGVPSIVNSGTGICFPATQNASSNANTLDDYEEGSFTPELSFGNGTTGITYNARNGTYVKIGRLVFVRFGMYLTSKGSSTGTARVSGLPFTSYSESYSDPSIVFNGGGFTGLTAGLTGIFLNGDTRIEIRANTTTGTALMDNTYFNNTTEFYGSACYYATA